MTAPGAAVTTEATRDVTFTGHTIADGEAAHLLTHLDDLTDIFVADVHRHWNRLLRPFIPLPDMDVGAADRGLADADEDIVMADFGPLHARQSEAGRAFELGEGFHCV